MILNYYINFINFIDGKINIMNLFFDVEIFLLIGEEIIVCLFVDEVSGDRVGFFFCVVFSDLVIDKLDKFGKIKVERFEKIVVF